MAEVIQITLAGLVSTIPATSATTAVKLQWLADALYWAETNEKPNIVTDARAGLLYSRQAEILDNMIAVSGAELTSLTKTIA